MSAARTSEVLAALAALTFVACGLSVVGRGGTAERDATSTDPATPTPPAELAAESGGAGDATPPLACTSDATCPKDRHCCYAAGAGASCASSCEDSAIHICLGAPDDCGEDHRCEPLAQPPAPGVGGCVKNKQD